MWWFAGVGGLFPCNTSLTTLLQHLIPCSYFVSFNTTLHFHLRNSMVSSQWNEPKLPLSDPEVPYMDPIIPFYYGTQAIRVRPERPKYVPLHPLLLLNPSYLYQTRMSNIRAIQSSVVTEPKLAASEPNVLYMGLWNLPDCPLVKCLNLPQP